jgi:hypothetical protein
MKYLSLVAILAGMLVLNSGHHITEPKTSAHPLVGVTLCSDSYTDIYGSHCIYNGHPTSKAMQLRDLITSTFHVYIGNSSCRNIPHIIRLLVFTIFEEGTAFQTRYFEWKTKGTCFAKPLLSFLDVKDIPFANNNLAFSVSVDGWPVQELVVEFNQ